MTAIQRHPLLLPLVLLIITAAVYWPGLTGSWLFDDYPNVVTNNLVHPDALSWATILKAARAYEPGGYGRPIATLSFALDYLISGKNPWIYKLHSLLVHLINAALVFALLRRLLALPRVGSAWPPIAAFAIALLWAVHPLQVSSVLYVVQRMELLALTFVLLALLAYLRGRTAQIEGRRGWPWLVLCALATVAGMLAKETAALVPLYALALEVTLLRFDADQPRTRAFLKWAYAAGAAAGIALFVFYVVPHFASAEAFRGRDFDLYQRLLTQCRVLPMYLGQILLPLPAQLKFYYDAYPVSTGWLHPATTLFGGLFLLALLGAAWRARTRFPLLALGILWFFAAHFLTSNAFNLELVFEHRNYFALLGILLALGDLVGRIRLSDGPGLKYVTVGAIMVAVAFLGTLRAAVWGNELELAMSLVAYSPESPRASSDLATLYAGMSDSNPNSPFFSMGMKEFERGSRLPSSSPLPEQGLILMAATVGQPVDPAWWDSLIHKLQTRPTGIQESLAVTGLLKQRYAGITLDDHRLMQALEVLLSRNQGPAQLYAETGDYALAYLHDSALADRMFVAAIECNPSDKGYAQKVLGVLLADGHVQQAQAVLERGTALGLFEKASPAALSGQP
jgi:hypothetical protein